jgi:serine/threonine protein kinase
MDDIKTPDNTGTTPEGTGSAPRTGTGTFNPARTATGTFNQATRHGTGTFNQDGARAAAARDDFYSDIAAREFVIKSVKYLSMGHLKRGGEADVFLVENGGTRYALKIFRSSLHNKPEVQATVHSMAKSGFVVPLLDFGTLLDPATQRSHEYELMSYCEGGSLDKMNLRGDEKTLTAIAIKGAAAINALHSRRFIHRDVKPANFLFARAGNNPVDLMLADFGITVACNASGACEDEIQPRTELYAAPEIYKRQSSIHGYGFNLTNDWFSFGMTLLALWIGEGAFEQNRDTLDRQKNRKGGHRLPYPDDMSARMLELIKALTHPDESERADFEAIKRWQQGETIYRDPRGGIIGDFNVVYNGAKNLVAHTPEELAQMMWDDKALAIRYLRQGKIEEWLKYDRPELASGIREIAEDRYPKADAAALHATCYYLDPTMPYYDVNSSPQNDATAIAASLQTNFEHYSRALKNPDDSLFIWLSAHGANAAVATFTHWFAKTKPEVALRRMIYTLDTKSPWVVYYTDDTCAPCYTPDDIIRACYPIEITDESWYALASEAFTDWLILRDKALTGKILSTDGHDSRPFSVLYNLNPKVSYELQLDSAADDYWFTPKDIGRYMNCMLALSFVSNNKTVRGYAERRVNELLNISGSRLDDYLRSKNLEQWSTAIAKVTDATTADRRKSAAPFNPNIAAYVAIKTLGYEPFYFFADDTTASSESDDVRATLANFELHKRGMVFTLRELEARPSSEIRRELKHGALADWLTTLFHEETDTKKLDKTPVDRFGGKTYRYERALLRYVEYLGKLDPDNKWYNDYKDHQNSVKGPVQSDVRRYRKWRCLRAVGEVALPVLAAALTVAVGYLLCIYRMPQGIEIPNWLRWSIVGLGVLIGLTGGLWGAIIGAVAGVVVVFLLNLILAYSNFIVAVAVLGVLVWMLCLYFKNRRSGYGKIKVPTPANDFEHFYLEPLYGAIKGNFQSSLKVKHYSSVGMKRDAASMLGKFGIVLGGVAAGCLLLWFMLSKTPFADYKPAGNSVTEKALNWTKTLFGGDMNNIDDCDSGYEPANYGALAGKWTGKWGGHEATLNIVAVEDDRITATVSVPSAKVNANLTGKVVTENDIVSLQLAGGAQNGRYNGKINDAANIYEGTFHDDGGNKNGITFRFSKQQTNGKTVEPKKSSTEPKKSSATKQRIDYNAGYYEGEVKDEKPNGYGKYVFNNGNWYEGYWKNGMLNGQATHYSAEAKRTDKGEYKDNKRTGKGRMEWENGNWFEGEWNDNGFNGQATYYNASAKRTDKGEYKDSNRSGRGTMTWANGNRYEGTWQDNSEGKLNGEGVFYYADGKSEKGRYINSEWKPAN